MSEDIVPEWLRLKREIEALVRGIWNEIFRIDDQVEDLTKRVKDLEDSKLQ